MRKLLRSVARHNMKRAGIQHMNPKAGTEKSFLCPQLAQLRVREVEIHEVGMTMVLSPSHPRPDLRSVQVHGLRPLWG